MSLNRVDRLNVIFHGPFIFVFYRDRVEVLAAEIDQHTFGAGNWQEETPCNPGVYFLRWIKTQGSMQGPEDADHVIINAPDIQMKIAQDAYYQFVLPLPSLMKALGKLTLGAQPFVGGDVENNNIKVPSKIGTAHLLSYELNEDDTPQLDGFYWKPDVKGVNGKYVSNLHIFAESPFALDDFHPNRDFGRLMQMLPGVSLGILRPFPDVTSFDPNPDVYTLGIEDQEQGGLRGLPKKTYVGTNGPLIPPRICDSPSVVVTNADAAT